MSQLYRVVRSGPAGPVRRGHRRQNVQGVLDQELPDRRGSVAARDGRRKVWSRLLEEQRSKLQHANEHTGSGLRDRPQRSQVQTECDPLASVGKLPC